MEKTNVIEIEKIPGVDRNLRSSSASFCRLIAMAFAWRNTLPSSANQTKIKDTVIVGEYNNSKQTLRGQIIFFFKGMAQTQRQTLQSGNSIMSYWFAWLKQFNNYLEARHCQKNKIIIHNTRNWCPLMKNEQIVIPWTQSCRWMFGINIAKSTLT